MTEAFALCAFLLGLLLAPRKRGRTLFDVNKLPNRSYQVIYTDDESVLLEELGAKETKRYLAARETFATTRILQAGMIAHLPSEKELRGKPSTKYPCLVISA